MKLDWTLTIGGIIALSAVIFGVCAFIVRSKDMQSLRPMIESIPLMQQDIGSLKVTVAKIEGIMSVIPAMTAHSENQAQRLDKCDKDHERLEDRVLALERGSHKT